MKVVTDDGSEMEIGPGNAYVICPGHDAWIIGNEPCGVVDVSSVVVEKLAKEAEPIDKAKDKM